MRFSALLRKELRECLPWLLLAALAFSVIGGFFLRREQAQRQRWFYDGFSPYSVVSLEQSTQPSSLRGTGPVLLITSIGLGLILGVRHFWIPHFTGTWPFLLHRSVSRLTIFWGKFAAATLAFIISLGTIWTIFYWYACRPELFIVPPMLRVFIEGWIFLVLGLVVYLGAALVGISTARWYTTRIFALGVCPSNWFSYTLLPFWL
jgi:ABC-type transport system involved in multi-copper enzyme maturation permease subunit